jgi:hypothetical protein
LFQRFSLENSRRKVNSRDQPKQKQNQQMGQKLLFEIEIHEKLNS